jgi:hypothetical protein
MIRIPTTSGGTVEAQRVPAGWDVHVKARDGRTVATVLMDDETARVVLFDHKAGE